MENLIFQPSFLVPIILIALILIVLVAIIAVSINQAAKRKAMRRQQSQKMKKMAAAVSNVNLVGQEMEEFQEETVKPVKSVAKKKESGDKTIYDDRKKLTDWQVHLSKTYKDMKKKNPNAKFSAAMKAAKKTYKKAKK